jgi:predicted TIM-barrel fold metal-dependent hydrolase
MNEAAIPAGLQGIKIIDMDTHLTEAPDLWTSRVPAASKHRVPALRKIDGVEQWYLGEQPMGAWAGGSALSVVDKNNKKHLGILSLQSHEEVHAACIDAKARLKMMDELGIHAHVVYPNIAGFGGGSFARGVPVEDRNLVIRIYNEAVADWAKIGNGRLRPQALIPFWDIKKSVEEVRYAHSLGLRGIAMTSTPELWGDEIPDFGHTHWDPFWEVCSDLDVPISFHIAGGNTGFYAWKTHMPSDQLSNMGQKMQGPASIAIVEQMLNARIILNMIYSDLFDRWPKLKFVSVESGIGWIPWLMENADYQFSQFKTADNWGLKRQPSEYLKDHFYISWWFEKNGPKNVIDYMGSKNILFETDFPHPTCLYPDPLTHLDDALKDISFEAKQDILQNNSAKLWEIPLN